MLVDAAHGGKSLQNALRSAPQPAAQVLVLARDVFWLRWLYMQGTPRLIGCSLLVVSTCAVANNASPISPASRCLHAGQHGAAQSAFQLPACIMVMSPMIYWNSAHYTVYPGHLYLLIYLSSCAGCSSMCMSGQRHAHLTWSTGNGFAGRHGAAFGCRTACCDRSDRRVKAEAQRHVIRDQANGLSMRAGSQSMQKFARLPCSERGSVLSATSQVNPGRMESSVQLQHPTCHSGHLAQRCQLPSA